MKQFLMGLAISAAFIIGCVTATVANDAAVPRANSAAPAGVQRWEYKCQSLRVVNTPKEAYTEEMEILTPAGQAGWELVTVENFRYCFKRPLS